MSDNPSGGWLTSSTSPFSFSPENGLDESCFAPSPARDGTPDDGHDAASVSLSTPLDGSLDIVAVSPSTPLDGSLDIVAVSPSTPLDASLDIVAVSPSPPPDGSPDIVADAPGSVLYWL